MRHEPRAASEPARARAASQPRRAGSTFDAAVRADFPILGRQVHGKPLVYLDNAATTQKPQVVIDALTRYYTSINANVHRGVHELSELRDRGLRGGAREGPPRSSTPRATREIVFTRNATEGINLVAHAFGSRRLSAGDEVVISAMEHHSNIVPWQLLCEERGARLRVAPIDDRGELILDELEALLTRAHEARRRSAHISNALGTINPVARDRRAGARARRAGAGRRRAGGVPHAGRRAGARLRLLRRLPATSCTARPASACSTAGGAARGDAAVPGRRRHDPLRHVREVDLERAAVQVRGRHADIAGAIGLGAALDYIDAIGLERDRRARARSARLRHARAREHSPACA